MDRLKTFAKYALLLIGFYILSNILIFVGLNSSYDNISPKEEIPQQIEITKAEATIVNGRISGIIKNSNENNLNGKYIKIDLYTPRDILVGTKYLQITDLNTDAQEEFKTYFKAQDVEYYKISIVDEAENIDGNLDVFISEEMKMYAIIGAVIALYFLI